MKSLRTPKMGMLMIALFWQATSHAATITGIVAELGQPIAEAEVMLVNADTSIIIKSVYSAGDGSFRFSVSPGKFNVGVMKPDYITHWSKGVNVDTADVVLRVELMNKAFADGKPANTKDDCN